MAADLGNHVISQSKRFFFFLAVYEMERRREADGEEEISVFREVWNWDKV